MDAWLIDCLAGLCEVFVVLWEGEGVEALSRVRHGAAGVSLRAKEAPQSRTTHLRCSLCRVVWKLRNVRRIIQRLPKLTQA